ncbi:hypothetical protein Acr_29g0008740 [Actinidia rufa]|uniref:Uncharacterized protein n=1 Tax=Actinidia rufa TaxID=165716 RepID=A0A7J0HF83_9ERIC|nr:hypothetical protein Acr_00g0038490 [Actinidia rufa]GFZ21712.1 hypothetical protein Acr_29g0008740 [Actinidia rufa]
MLGKEMEKGSTQNSEGMWNMAAMESRLRWWDKEDMRWPVVVCSHRMEGQWIELHLVVHITVVVEHTIWVVLQRTVVDPELELWLICVHLPLLELCCMVCWKANDI